MHFSCVSNEPYYLFFQTLTKQDFVDHFDKFGDVVEVFIPDPWRHFAFVTFAEQRVAASLIGKEHNVKVSLSLMRCIIGMIGNF